MTKSCVSYRASGTVYTAIDIATGQEVNRSRAVYFPFSTTLPGLHLFWTTD